MYISEEEKLMYRVMEAIYDSGIPMDFKGAMVLKACLIEAGFSEEIRHTTDIDANWYSDSEPTPEQMTDSIEEALRNSNIDLNVVLYRPYGRGRSAGFDFKDPETGDNIFSLDVDVNRPIQPTKIYEISGLCFRGIIPLQMIADKVSAVSTDRVFRRIKDVVDLYYFSNVFTFDSSAVIQTLEDSGRILGSFDGFLNRQKELKHAYQKYRFTGDVNKPSFEEVYFKVKTYIKDMLPIEINKEIDHVL